jgi:hypothetical protein
VAVEGESVTPSGGSNVIVAVPTTVPLAALVAITVTL